MIFSLCLCAYCSWRRADQCLTNTPTDTPTTGSQENSIRCARSLPWYFHRSGALAREGAHLRPSSLKTPERLARKPPQRILLGRHRRAVAKGVAARKKGQKHTFLLFFTILETCGLTPITGAMNKQSINVYTELPVICPVAGFLASRLLP